MQLVRMLRGTVGGAPARPLAVGEEVSLADEEARRFIASGRAEPIVEAPDAAAPAPKHRDPGVGRTRGAR